MKRAQSEGQAKPLSHDEVRRRAHVGGLLVLGDARRDLADGQLPSWWEEYRVSEDIERALRQVELGKEWVRPLQELALALGYALTRGMWPAAGFADTEIGCFMKPEVAYAAKTVRA